MKFLSFAAVLFIAFLPLQLMSEDSKKALKPTLSIDDPIPDLSNIKLPAWAEKDLAEGTPPDLPTQKSEDFKELIARAEQGDAEAQCSLGSKYFYGKGLNQDPLEARKWLHKSAEQGNKSAQFGLIMLYALWQGDPTEMADWYRKGAEAGLAIDQYQLGLIYIKGRGVEKNPSEAIKWYRKAAEQGITAAQLDLSDIYDAGKIVQQDSVESLKWSLEAAKKGDARAQFNTGIAYDLGKGTKKNTLEAVKWYRMAAEQGHSKAQYNLGGKYAVGEGVIKDEVESLAWLYLAHANGLNASAAISTLESNGKEFSLHAQHRAKELQSEINKKNPQPDNNRIGTAENGSIKAAGTGTFISFDGLILTAAHVVDGSSRLKVSTKDGIVSAKVISIDRKNDIALVKADGAGVPVPVVNSAPVKLGQKVFTLGFPNPELQGRNLKMTDGSISSLGGLQDDPRQWQISVPVQTGNSGGPLFDEQGNLIGVVVAKLDAIKAAKFTGDLPQNVNYAVKSAYILPLIEPYESAHLVPNFRTAQPTSMDSIVERVQDSVVLILVY